VHIYKSYCETNEWYHFYLDTVYIAQNTSANSTQKLQHTQNTLARILLPNKRHLPSTDLLRQLHWLPVSSRIQFKLASLYKR